MLFLDANSWFSTHRELKKQIELLEEQKLNLQRAIKKDREMIKKLSNKEELEKFAGTYYNPKDSNEKTVFIIEDNKLVHIINDEFKN